MTLAHARPERHKVALLGFGTVGQSVARILCTSPDGPLELGWICTRNVAKRRAGWVPSDIRWSERIDERAVRSSPRGKAGT